MRQAIHPAFVRLKTSSVPPLSEGPPGSDPLGHMASMMAHDLNNILQVVSGNLTLAIADPDVEGSRRRLDTSLAALRSGTDLTTNILDYCRQRGSSSLPDTVITAAHVTGMTPLLRDAVGDEIEVDVHVGPDLWPFRANLHRLRNALLNLVINAKEAMAGQGHLRLDTGNICCPEGGDQIWVSVTDDGPGIPPAILDQVLVPFYTTKPNGTGLGLAAVAEFARMSGADLVIESRLTFGTRVTIEFPRCA